jgi:hypothetical protein
MSHTKIFCCVGIWNLCTTNEDGLLSNLLVVKSIYTDLDSLSFIRRFLMDLLTATFKAELEAYH